VENGPTCNILLVDDLPSWRDLLSTILEKDGYNVKTANDFQEAKGLLQMEKFDIAIFDMRLIDHAEHNIQGMALVREAKTLQPSIKAIILTGYPDPKQKARALNFYGADGYYEKAPEGEFFDIETFSELIENLL
jgi:DNA-binding NtrC family response regulator